MKKNNKYRLPTKALNEKETKTISVVVLDDTGSLSIQAVECMQGKSIEKQIDEQVNTRSVWFY